MEQCRILFPLFVLTFTLGCAVGTGLVLVYMWREFSVLMRKVKESIERDMEKLCDDIDEWGQDGK